MRYTKDEFNQRSAEIKAVVTIQALWVHLYGSKPGKWDHCRVPWREDRHPSFWISRDGQRWKDHARSETGDVFDFWRRATGCDSGRAFKDLSAMAGGEIGSGSTPVRVEPVSEKPKRQFHPRLRQPIADELAAIAVLRSISIDGLGIAVARGLLWTIEWKEAQAFVVTDKTRKCYTVRKINGELWDDGVKAVFLPGSNTHWAIGIREARDFPAIALCEGGPDFLAGFGHAFASGAEDRVSPVCMANAGASIADDALPLFAGKRVRVFAHNDVAGHIAFERWKSQLDGIASKIDSFDFTGLIQSDGSPVNDLNDLSRIDVDSWEDNKSRIESVMDF